jgi:steroid delta-isomerase-like uncharacterized protein
MNRRHTVSDQSHNKRIARRAIEEVYTGGNLDMVDELVTSDIVAHSPGVDFHGVGELKQFVQSLREAFPDLRMTVEDQVAEGHKVVTRWIARGTHEGSFLGIPPTGKTGTMTGVEIDRFVDGKVSECWTSADYLGLMQQLGAIPESGAAR